MTERPILFSAPMIRALLDGSKTQTRRVCKQQPYPNGYHWNGNDIDCHNDYLPPSAMLMDFGGKLLGSTSNLEGWESLCPYGQPGDQLYVRETFAETESAPYADGQSDVEYIYRATFPVEHMEMVRWKPSIHMPRVASRIRLEILSVRCEPLNDCSEEDAIAEGTRRVGSGFERWHPDPADTEHTGTTRDPVLSYRGLWESINGAGSWAANPWVWVVEFKRVPS